MAKGSGQLSACKPSAGGQSSRRAPAEHQRLRSDARDGPHGVQLLSLTLPHKL